MEGAQTVYQFLKSSNQFEAFSDDVLRSVSELAALRHFEPGQTILEEDAEATGLFILKEGNVRITKQSNGTLKTLKANCLPGDVFGELSLYAQAKTSAGVTAESPVTCIYLSKHDFTRLLSYHHGLVVQLLPMLTKAARICYE